MPDKTSSQFIIYQTEGGQTKIEVRLEDETVWLTQKLMAELFQVTPQNITLHLKNIYEEGELDEQATCKDFLQVQQEGTRAVKRKQKLYNLDAIISVCYHVQSHVATRFRQWATRHIREYIVKGFVLDDERLKNPDQPFDYFDELLKRIQDIRTSEKRFYQKITDIYATSVDYDPTLDTSITFFKTVQNKLHWAITGQTAAEIIKARANAGCASVSSDQFSAIVPALLYLLHPCSRKPTPKYKVEQRFSKSLGSSINWLMVVFFHSCLQRTFVNLARLIRSLFTTRIVNRSYQADLSPPVSNQRP
jgi:hypothetical protein